ncbi:MAG: hypothetical protein U0K70_05860 [Acutalibacteraceae bacterium]|nr:hypothetical protein [Acutalibacteraceae bacterium]
MAVGFRKSLFGFNCDDVMKYIERSQKSFAEKEKDLTNQVEELSKSLDLSNENYRKLNDEKELIAKKLADFSEKYEEIERLSENIGKLYLVAQANAQAIMANSEENANLANSEVEKNLSAINDAHESLDSLRKSVIQTSNEFLCEIDGLISSLNETKETIAANIASDEEHKNQFNEVFRTLTK